jgi:glyoxylase-like metal-dependent hydrolase (beta-lactamase superfamily II)
VIKDSMFGTDAPDVERWSARVAVVRGLNPGPFTGPGTNTYLIGTGEHPLLLDTGSGQEGYVPLLAQALQDECGASEPGDVVLTHVHPDHIGGAADVVARFGPRKVYKRPWPGRDDSYQVELTPLDEGDVLRTEGATLRALHTPGHAEDHLCFYLEEERALFTGDVVLGLGTTVIPLQGGHMGTYLDTLHRLLELDVQLIYPGHGPLISDAKGKLREYIEHRGERERQILEALRAGVNSVREMVERIYVDTPRALHPAAGQSVLSHLIKLEDESRVTRSLDSANEEHWTLR